MKICGQLAENIFLTNFVLNFTISRLQGTTLVALFGVIGLSFLSQSGRVVQADVYSSGGIPMENIPRDYSYYLKNTVLNFNASNYLVSASSNQSEKNGLRLIFQLVDVKANQSIPYVTYWINITRVSTHDSAKSILNDFFQVPLARPLVLNIQQPSQFQQGCINGTEDIIFCNNAQFNNSHISSPNILVHANRDPILQAWIQDINTNSVELDSPAPLENGQYHAQITIIGVNNPKSIFSDENSPKFEESWTLTNNVVVVPEFPDNLLIVSMVTVMLVSLFLCHRRLASKIGV